MIRREFITLFGGAATWPLAARAQPVERVRRVGVFMDLAENDREGQTRVAAFRDGMKALGWIEGRNVNYVYRWTAGNPPVMERYAAELLTLKPEIIMNGGLPTLAVMQKQTQTIPIVFAQVLDPVGAGFVESLAHPGGVGVDDELEFARLHDRQVRRLGALKDTTGIDAGLTMRIRQARSVAHQPTDFGI